MNEAETAIILDYLATAYRVVVAPEELAVWAEHLKDVDPDVAMDAAERIVGAEKFFPYIATFQQEVAAVLRERLRERQLAATRGETGPRQTCVVCRGVRWYEVDPLHKVIEATGEIQVTYEQWRPCQACAPIEFARWLQWKTDSEAERRYRLGPDSLLDFEPRKVISHARQLLQETP